MEFNEKLQQLRKRKGMTQEELAEVLYVSRTAVSKWESGRGYPNIDSLKAIATFFHVTIDELLSGDELITLAQEERQQSERRQRDLVYGLLDVSSALLLFLPFFGQEAEGSIRSVSLLSLTGAPGYLKAAYLLVVTGMILLGVLLLVLQNTNLWQKSKVTLSLGLNTAGVLLMIISQQPYAATLLFVFLMIKGFLAPLTRRVSAL
ncbi:MAG: helix-turn-helix transcriptional regulator [Clostridia bacterium]|nr:helix-turn-helix transcriptional regulator [Clostridia bacterium]